MQNDLPKKLNQPKTINEILEMTKSYVITNPYNKQEVVKDILSGQEKRRLKRKQNKK